MNATPLHYLVTTRLDRITLLLLSKGAKIDAKDFLSLNTKLLFNIKNYF